MTLALIGLVVQVTSWTLIGMGVRRAWRQADADETESNSGKFPALSVIVAARNEALNIGPLLERLTRQDYPQFEVIVVDDGSDDQTADIIGSMSGIRLVSEPGKGKKHALTAGIREARHDLLVFTDADCRPSTGWLSRIGSMHARLHGHRIIVGYAPLTAKKGLLGRFKCFDAALNQVFGAAAIGWNRPYMCTGRNLSYDRPLFEKVGGFEAHSDLLSGDDDLFLQTARHHATVRWLQASDAFVFSPVREGLLNWVAQKRRHTSTGLRFPSDARAFLGVHHLSNWICWSAPIWAGLPGFIALGLRILTQMIALDPVWRHLDERDFTVWTPVLSLWNACYSLAVPVTGIIKAPTAWQDRS